ncbi:hypothetical protein DM790_25870 [Flavobacterium collinsii]|nr:hypothetical protein [Flavobacterium collinsii]
MIILYYLSDEDSHQFTFNTSRVKMEMHTLFIVNNREDFLAFFNAYNYEENEIIICAHGGSTGISKTQNIDESFISWTDLLNLIANIGNDVKLNLCAICSSFNILNFQIPNNIKLILYSETGVNSILTAIDLFEKNYKLIINSIEDEDGELLYSAFEQN